MFPENTNGESPQQLPEDPDPEVKKAFANQLTTIIIALEGLVGVGGIFLGSWTGIRWSNLLMPEPIALGLGFVTGLALIAMHAVLLFPGGDRNPLRRWVLKPFANTFLDKLKMLSVEDIVLISVLSGTAEELMFRGWLQTEYHIVTASIVFGIIHIWGREGIPYGLYAVGIGFILGGVYAYTGNLWAPAIAHVTNNLFGLLANKYDWLPRFDNSD